ncbi:hypothetical protein TURU_119722 [Turdus rufiventris]|nr:hypothetical protein TURU_119722 [Turdus rufiventris]
MPMDEFWIALLITFLLLHQIRELAEPTVTCEAQNCSSDGSCHFSLRCSVSGTDLGNVSYTWRMGDRLWGEGPVVLWVDKSDLEGPEQLTCTAQNPVSNRSFTVTNSDLCTGALSCCGVRIWLVAGVAVEVLLLLFCKPRGSLSTSAVTIGLITAIGIKALLLALLLFLHKSKGELVEAAESQENSRLSCLKENRIERNKFSTCCCALECVRNKKFWCPQVRTELLVPLVAVSVIAIIIIPGSVFHITSFAPPTSTDTPPDRLLRTCR